MAEYIDRKVATNAIGNIDTSKLSDDKDDIVEKAIGLIDHLPTADVVEVKHGQWDRGICTNCNKPWDYLMRQNADDDGYFDPMPPFCLNCGAKMDL